jgi:hypothetical protein
MDFAGLELAMSIHPLSEIRDFWSSKPLCHVDSFKLSGALSPYRPPGLDSSDDTFDALGREGDIHGISEATDYDDISAMSDSNGDSTTTDSGFISATSYSDSISAIMDFNAVSVMTDSNAVSAIIDSGGIPSAIDSSSISGTIGSGIISDKGISLAETPDYRTVSSLLSA